MARYVTLEPFWDGARLVPSDTEIDFDGEPGPNLKPIDKAAQKAAAAVPEDAVARFIAAVRLHAATRGVSPEAVNESDFDDLVRGMDVKPSDETVKAAAAVLGVQLGVSLA